MVILFGKCKSSFVLIIAQLVVLIAQLNSKNFVTANSYLNDDKNVLIPKSSQFCEGCYATVDIILQEFSKDVQDIKGPYRMDEKWIELETNLCDTSKLTKYVYSPPKVVKVCKQMFQRLKNDLLDVIQNFNMMSFEEHVKNTCIKKLDACINYLSIPSVERKIERELEKEKREKSKQETEILEATENVKDTVSSVNEETENVKRPNDEL